MNIFRQYSQSILTTTLLLCGILQPLTVIANTLDNSSVNYIGCLRKELKEFELEVIRNEYASMTPREAEGYHPRGYEIPTLFPTYPAFQKYFVHKCHKDANKWLYGVCMRTTGNFSACLEAISFAPANEWTGRTWEPPHGYNAGMFK
jgi:hypothetical protein